ncbi:unnamed protein product [Cunninghamella echinulata]
MERESFENEDIAKLMNKYYVNIKVDREENPGVDKLYMTYVTYTTGHGGWPTSVFLTPEKYPFFGATYLPPTDGTTNRTGFKTILSRIAQIWISQPDKIRSSGESTITQLKQFIEAKPSSSTSLDANKIADSTLGHFTSSYDSIHGGFGDAPKFPTPVQLRFLMDYHYYNQQKDSRNALEMALSTLESIARGGIHDHIGHGFHRYSTDSKWHVPHFEKMLYDQAQLLTCYSIAAKLSDKPIFQDTLQDIITYLKYNMLNKEGDGGFYSAEDADSLPSTQSSEKIEGAFYVWENTEIDAVLKGHFDDNVIKLFKEYFVILPDGNVDPLQDPHNELQLKNVLYINESLEKLAKKYNQDIDRLKDDIVQCKNVLSEYKMKNRPKPHCDDKIITSWNGLVISGLVHAYEILKDESVLDLAIQTAEFINANLYDKTEKILYRCYRYGESPQKLVRGFGDDYCFLIQGLIGLYQAITISKNTVLPPDRILKWIAELQDTQNQLFYDSENGGYFNVDKKDTSILIRMKDEQDGAEPSINAVSANNLIQLASIITSKSADYLEKARDTINSFSLALTKFPFALPAMVSSLLLLENGIKEIIITGEIENEKTQRFIEIVRKKFTPNKLSIHVKDEKTSWLMEQNGIIQQIKKDRPSVYICEHFTCSLPIYDVDELISTFNQQ